MSGCYGSLSTIYGRCHSVTASALFVQGGKRNHGFLMSEDVTAADTIDREIIWSCNRLRQSKKQPETATSHRLLIMPGMQELPATEVLPN